jgi:hypothetical protein
VDPYNYLYLAALLFTIGAVGVVVRRNAIVVFMCIELMLNAGNLTLVTSRALMAISTAKSLHSLLWLWPHVRLSSALQLLLRYTVLADQHLSMMLVC